MFTVDSFQQAKNISSYVLSQLDKGTSYEAIRKDRSETVAYIIEHMKREVFYTNSIKEFLLRLCSTTIESDMNTIRNGSSCPAGCIPLIFCPCGALNRDCSVYCPNCHKQCVTSCNGGCCRQPVSDHPRCTHLTRSFSKDVTVVFHYPVMNGLLDSIFSGNDEFMHSLTNRERLVNVVFASENDVICQDLSVNMYAASRRFGDNEICSILRKNLESRKSPFSHMSYLIPDVQFAKKLTTNGRNL